MPLKLLAGGRSVRRAFAVDENGVGKVLLVKGTPGWPDWYGQAGKALGSNDEPVYAGQTSLKSPVRSAAEGTAWLIFCPGTISRRHSCDQKKNVFFFSLL